MDWYKVKEKSAGEIRLLFSWYLYKILGEKVLLFISFFISLITILTNKDLRTYSKEYFQAISDYFCNKELKPNFFNTFKHVLSYANSLVYKIESFDGSFDYSTMIFDDVLKENEMFETIANKQGMLFICSHIGNIEILRSLLLNSKKSKPPTISIFFQKDRCQIFNNFLKKIEHNGNEIKIYAIEDIDITTINQIDNELKQGGVVFIAGDRIAANNPEKSVETKLFNKKILLPIGAFKFPKLLNVPTFFISVIKEKKGYKIYLEKQESQNEITIRENYIKFLEKMTKIAPYQFYHFYDIFNNRKN